MIPVVHSELLQGWKIHSMQCNAVGFGDMIRAAAVLEICSELLQCWRSCSELLKGWRTHSVMLRGWEACSELLQGFKIHS